MTVSHYYEQKLVSLSIICRLYDSMPETHCDPLWIHFDKISRTNSNDKASELVTL